LSNPIPAENTKSGTTAWIFASGKLASTEIQGYVDATSYNPGDTVTFYVSTPSAATGYSINIYRLGYYGGTGATLVTSLTGLSSVAQGYWDGTTLQNCPTAIIDSTTHNCEAGWASSTTWTIPGGSCTGVYLAAFVVTSSGKQSFANFIVKGNATADYVLVRPYTTDQAYNDWGGYSLYTNPTVGTKVSFNRPSFYADGGSRNLFWYEVAFIKWAESQGYNLSYISDIDLHANAAQLLTYKAYISLGHDEYWSKAMRDGVEAAIAKGVNALFCGANASYWQIRLETDHAGYANKTVVCYKVTTSGANLATDPQYNVNNAIVTTNWRDALLGRPESSMVGIMYSGNSTSSYYIPFTTDPSMDTTYTAGTGLVANTSYGCDLVGSEWDKQQTGSPSNLKIIGTTTVTGPDTQNTTWYKALSGALVFATGSFGLTWGLDSYRRYSGSCTDQNWVVPQIQVLFRNIMGALKGPVFDMVEV
jgi:hypothetical protein